MIARAFTLFAVLASATAFTPLAAQRANSVRATRRPVVKRAAPAMFINLDPQPDFMWNINEQRGPFGFADNAEVWNGRVAMMSFFWLFIQEAFFGPITQPSSWEGLSFFGNVVFSGVFVLTLVGTIGQIWLNKKNDKYSEINLQNVEEYM